MLSQQDNELLSRVGPGTPMGEMMRQYWIPAVRADELPSPDCPPVRIKLLGEELIAFRVTSGAVGLMQNACPHRGASMFFGRNEEEGLRCVYHGWKFDVTGSCVDMPSEPAESNFRSKVHAQGLPVPGALRRDLGLHGPARRAAAPAGTRRQHARGVLDQRALSRQQLDAGHRGRAGHDPRCLPAQRAESGARRRAGHLRVLHGQSMHGDFSVRETDHGTSYGMYRPAEEDTSYWRVGHLLFPFYAMPPGASNLGEDARFLAYVPMDDYNTLEWSVGVRAPDVAAQGTFGREYIPNGTGWFERFRIEQNLQNDFKIDREAQKRGDSYTGIPGIRQQDMAMTETMGPIMDRTNEHLGTTDQMIIRTRRRYIAAAKALQEQGVTPPGVDNPKAYHQRSGLIILPRSVDWWEGTKELRERFDVPVGQTVESPAG